MTSPRVRTRQGPMSWVQTIARNFINRTHRVSPRTRIWSSGNGRRSTLSPLSPLRQLPPRRIHLLLSPITRLLPLIRRVQVDPRGYPREMRSPTRPWPQARYRLKPSDTLLLLDLRPPPARRSLIIPVHPDRTGTGSQVGPGCLLIPRRNSFGTDRRQHPRTEISKIGSIQSNKTSRQWRHHRLWRM